MRIHRSDRPAVPRPTGTTGASHIAALVAGLLAAGLVAMLRLHAVGAGPIDVVPFVDMFREAETSAERWLVAGDGQAHGLVAADPTISSPDLYGQDGAAYAYRAQRPLLGTLAFVLSGGIEDRVAPALVALFVLSGALLCWALRQHVPLRWAIALSAAVVVMCSQSPVAEPLGIALVLLGYQAYRDRRLLTAITALALAGLCRETLLIVPAAMAIWAMWQRSWADTARLAAAALPYMTWVAYLRSRTGGWPWQAGTGRLGSPLGGLLDAASRWTASDLLVLALLVLALGVLWMEGEAMRIVGLLHLGLLMVLGEDVWKSMADFGRVLSPALVLASVIAVTRRWEPLGDLPASGGQPFR